MLRNLIIVTAVFSLTACDKVVDRELVSQRTYVARAACVAGKLPVIETTITVAGNTSRPSEAIPLDIQGSRQVIRSENTYKILYKSGSVKLETRNEDTPLEKCHE